MQETFPDCSRSYVGARRGCSDPAASNYDAEAELHDHSCRYGCVSRHGPQPQSLWAIPTAAVS